MLSKIQPRFPIFIPSLSRSDSRLTIRALQRMGIEEWYAVVEPQEYSQYAAVIPKPSVITLKPAIRYQFKTGQRDWPKT
jgi:hypothetical protein